jgi:cell division protein FtsB
MRLALTLLPAALLLAVGASALWGDSGLLARYALRTRLAEASADLAALDRENQRMVRQLVALERDPRVVERAVADQIGWARPGTVVYTFPSGGGSQGGVTVPE